MKIKSGTNLHPSGDFIEFITDNKTYDSVVTGLKFKNTFKVSQVTLGEYRIKLTEKIQLMNKSITSTVGNIQIQNNKIIKWFNYVIINFKINEIL